MEGGSVLMWLCDDAPTHHAEKIRVLMLEQVAVILACWFKHEIEPHDSDVLEIIRRGLLDPAQSVRSASRDAICAFAAIWYELSGFSLRQMTMSD